MMGHTAGCSHKIDEVAGILTPILEAGTRNFIRHRVDGPTGASTSVRRQLAMITAGAIRSRRSSRALPARRSRRRDT
ncbi:MULTISPECIES: hypothetical protein [Mycobacteriaceae]|uniref:Uncharacterized protein n=2 Tax=Mycolicibacterium TaxID=1866885 RepID=A0ABR5FM63_9MYCO|nr:MULTISPECIES: hypothetical protein [Mycobacteriaceae]KLI09227.1 hypothetical protein AA982_03720 [Mycolicibacterium senegalense]KLO47619.1 hypothetical protein ABW05_30735 [Mycolicibacterium senegalense]OLT94326.1 hypothetical protein BKG60_18570 [Mycobacterium syngnathidarum]